MLSRDCDGCSQLHLCSERYKQVGKDQKVYCLTEPLTLWIKTNSNHIESLERSFFWVYPCSVGSMVYVEL